MALTLAGNSIETSLMGPDRELSRFTRYMPRQVSATPVDISCVLAGDLQANGFHVAVNRAHLLRAPSFEPFDLAIKFVVDVTYVSRMAEFEGDLGNS